MGVNKPTEFLWYIPNQVEAGHRGDAVAETTHARRNRPARCGFLGQQNPPLWRNKKPPHNLGIPYRAAANSDL